MSQELQVAGAEQQITKLANFESAEQMMDFAQILITSKLVPAAFNTKEKVVTAVLQGREIGLGPVTALSNIHVISGRATLSVHALGAMMKKKGIITETLKNYEPVKNEEGKITDFVTTIRFHQPIPGTVGKYITEDVSFTQNEAKLMELLTKDTWRKMPRLMLWNRCFAIGCRRVAPDAIMGLYETTEAADFSGVRYDVSEEGSVTVL